MKPAPQQGNYSLRPTTFIKIDKEILTWTYRKNEDDTDEPKTLELDAILSGDDDVSHWRERHQLWYARR